MMLIVYGVFAISFVSQIISILAHIHFVYNFVKFFINASVKRGLVSSLLYTFVVRLGGTVAMVLGS